MGLRAQIIRAILLKMIPFSRGFGRPGVASRQGNALSTASENG